MFNLFPLFQKPEWLTDTGYTIDGKYYSPADLMNEFIKLRDQLMQWIELYNEKADCVDELVKEVNVLRHLKKENVELIERVNEIDSDMNKEYQDEIFTLKNEIAVLKNRNTELLEKYNGIITMGGLKYMEARLQIVQNDYKKCAEQRDEYKHQLNAANKEIEVLKSKLRDYQDRLAVSFSYNDMYKVQKEIDQLKAWKKEQLTVQSWWDKVDSYVRDHDDAPLGGFVANTCLNFLKERDELKKLSEELKATTKHAIEDRDRWHNLFEEGIKQQREVEEDSKKRIDSLSLTIDRKNFEIDDLKAEIKKLKDDIVDYVIEKDDELKKAQDWKETVETLKNMKTQGFEDYDPSDFEVQKHPIHPLHWGILQNAKDLTKDVKVDLVKPLDEQRDDKTTAENLEKKFDEGKDVLDYFEEPKWKCPCNICKEGKVSWEQAASDLALRVIKLEKQIEELKIVNIWKQS